MPEKRFIITCRECKYFRAYTDGTYGNCMRTINHGAVYRTSDFCSYAEMTVSDIDNHDVSGLLEE